MHEEFANFLDRIAPTQGALARLAELVLQAVEERRAEAIAKESRQRADLDRINEQIQELIRMKTERLVTDEEFLSHKSLLTERRIALEGSRAAGGEVRHIRVDVNEVTQPLTELKKTWHDITEAFRRRFQRFVLPVGFVTTKIGTAELGLLFKVFGQLQDPNTILVPLSSEDWNQIAREIADISKFFRVVDEEKARTKPPVLELATQVPQVGLMEPPADRIRQEDDDGRHAGSDSPLGQNPREKMMAGRPVI